MLEVKENSALIQQTNFSTENLYMFKMQLTQTELAAPVLPKFQISKKKISTIRKISYGRV